HTHGYVERLKCSDDIRHLVFAATVNKHCVGALCICPPNNRVTNGSIESTISFAFANYCNLVKECIKHVRMSEQRIVPNILYVFWAQFVGKINIALSANSYNTN